MGSNYSSKVAGLIVKALCPLAMTVLFLLLNLTAAVECRRNIHDLGNIIQVLLNNNLLLWTIFVRFLVWLLVH